MRYSCQHRYFAVAEFMRTDGLRRQHCLVGIATPSRMVYIGIPH